MVWIDLVTVLALFQYLVFALLVARARGQATVEAEYVHGLPRLDRDIDVEVDIALRNGQARITRLSLFPNVP